MRIVIFDNYQLPISCAFKSESVFLIVFVFLWASWNCRSYFMGYSLITTSDYVVMVNFEFLDFTRCVYSSCKSRPVDVFRKDGIERYERNEERG